MKITTTATDEVAGETLAMTAAAMNTFTQADYAALTPSELRSAARTHGADASGAAEAHATAHSAIIAEVGGSTCGQRSAAAGVPRAIPSSGFDVGKQCDHDAS